MSEAEVAELRRKLERTEEQRDKLRAAAAKLKEAAANIPLLRERLTSTREELAGAQGDTEAAQRQAAEAQQGLQQEQRRRVMAEQAAAAAKAAAVAAEQQAAQSAAAARAAAADAADVRRQLRDVQAQLARLQAACDSGAAVARQQQAGPAQQQQQQQLMDSAAGAALQDQVQRMAAELERWRAALGPLAALAAGGMAVGGAPPAPAAPQPLAPQPAMLAGRPTSPQKQRRAAGRQRGPSSPLAANPAAAAAGKAAGAPAAPQAPAEDARAKAVRQVAARKAAAAEAGAGATAGGVGGGGTGRVGGKRGRPAAAAGAPPTAARNAFEEALGALEAGRPGGAKRAKQAQQQGPASAAPAAAPAAAPPPPPAPAEPSLAVSGNEQAVGQQREHTTEADEAAELLGQIVTAAGRGGPGPSTRLAFVQGRAAQLHIRLAERRLPLQLLLGCFQTVILECAAPRPQGQLLLPATFIGTAGIPAAAGAAAAGAAAAEGVVAEDGPADGADAAAARPAAGPEAAGAAEEASSDAWFGPAPGLASSSPGPAGQKDGQRLGAPPPFVAVWCKREALAGRHIHWLLHCAAHIRRLEGARLAAAAAAAPSEDSLEPSRHLDSGEGPGGDGRGGKARFAAALQRSLHREVLDSCLAASSGRPRHGETEVCALAAAAAALCRMHGKAEEMLALLLDLVSCGAAAAAVLPPLAAALDVWPAPLASALSGAAASEGAATGEPLGSGFHAALQRLCSQAATAGAGAAEGHAGHAAASPQQEQQQQHPTASTASGVSAGGSVPPPPPLLPLERLQAAAAVYLRRLGQRLLGWQEGAEGDPAAAQQFLATLEGWRPGDAGHGDAGGRADAAARAAAGASKAALLQAAAAAAGTQAPTRPIAAAGNPAGAGVHGEAEDFQAAGAGMGMADVEVEEI